jgi:hypothetical protein
MAAMSVVSYASRSTYTASPVAYYNSPSSGHLPALDLPHFDPSRPLYYFGIPSKKRGVHLLSFFHPLRHPVQFSTFGSLCASNISLLSAVYDAGKQKEAALEEEDVFVHYYESTHSAEQRAVEQIFLFSSDLWLQPQNLDRVYLEQFRH